jgi:enamine deaminase RidA (YjgF/YER057c/UK114 family)
MIGTDVAGAADKRLRALGFELPAPPPPLGAYVEAVQTGDLLFLTGMLATHGSIPTVVGRLGKDLDTSAGRAAAMTAALNALSVAKHTLGSLDLVRRVVRLGVYLATYGDFNDHAKVADGASELFLAVFGPKKTSARMVFGISSLPLNVPVELDVILEVDTP